MKTSSVLLLVAVAAVFGPALAGAYVSDDRVLVGANAALQHGDFGALVTRPLFGANGPYWRPLTVLLLWLGHQLGGAAGIHGLALLLHGANTLRVLALARRFGLSEGRAAFVAALFALHPVQVEPVAWCAAIAEPVWAACALAAVSAALRWRERGAAGAPWLAGACTFAALLAKESGAVTVVLVAAALATAPSPSGGARVPWPRVLGVLAAAVATWWLLRVLALGPGGHGAAAAAAPEPAMRAITGPFELLLGHLGLLVQPLPCTPFRALAEERSAAVSFLFVLACVVLLAALAAWCRRGPRERWFAAALLLVPLVPPLVRFQDVGAYPLADRYLYVSVAGFAWIAADVAWVPRRAPWPWLLVAVAALFAALHVRFWRDEETLVVHARESRPDDAGLAVRLGDLQLARARDGDAAAVHEARRCYERAQQLAGPVRPDRVAQAAAAAQLGLAWCLLLEQRGQRGPGTARLVAAFECAVALSPADANAHTGLGVARGIAGQYTGAEEALRRALALDRDHAEAWYNLAFLQTKTGQRDRARQSLAEALRCRPDNDAARRLLDTLR